MLDTNAILRYLLQDDNEAALAVKLIIAENNCLITTEVCAEVVYVLLKVYKVSREIIAKNLIDFFAIRNITVVSSESVKTGLLYFATTKLDFIDCLMIGYQRSGYSIFTFDQKLKKQLQKQGEI
jgi:predicted nucleic-acid-binding protein